jgi:hypothetical protein
MDGRRLESEAGIETGVQVAETQGDETRHVLGIPARGSETDLERGHLAIDTEKEKAKSAYAGTILHELAEEIGKGAPGCYEDVLLGHDRLGEGDQSVITGRRADKINGFRGTPESLVEAEQEMGAEPSSERRTRLLRQISDLPKAQAVQERQGLIGQTQCGERKVSDGRCFPIGRHDKTALVVKTRDPPGRTERTGCGDAWNKTEAAQAVSDIVE